jgi:hypothetical protein
VALQWSGLSNWGGQWALVVGQLLEMNEFTTNNKKAESDSKAVKCVVVLKQFQL